MKKTYVLYHAQCPDGFGAAYSIWKKYKTKDMIYIAVQHSFPPPFIEKNSNVWLVDFCYSVPIMNQIAEKAKEILILDHHQSAYDNMQAFDFDKFSHVKAIFDMNKSGAVMTWEYFYPQQEVPLFLKYIEDKDLWRFNLPQSKEFSAGLRAYPFDFVVWGNLTTEQIIKEGEILLRFQNQSVEKICKNARLHKVAGYEILIANSPIFQSEIGNQLCQQNPQHAFSAVYFDVGNQRNFSLRSIGDFDVAKIAAQYGGGGHKNAAGFVKIIDSWEV